MGKSLGRVLALAIISAGQVLAETSYPVGASNETCTGSITLPALSLSSSTRAGKTGIGSYATHGFSTYSKTSNVSSSPTRRSGSQIVPSTTSSSNCTTSAASITWTSITSSPATPNFSSPVQNCTYPVYNVTTLPGVGSGASSCYASFSTYWYSASGGCANSTEVYSYSTYLSTKTFYEEYTLCDGVPRLRLTGPPKATTTTELDAAGRWGGELTITETVDQPILISSSVNATPVTTTFTSVKCLDPKPTVQAPNCTFSPQDCTALYSLWASDTLALSPPCTIAASATPHTFCQGCTVTLPPIRLFYFSVTTSGDFCGNYSVITPSWSGPLPATAEAFGTTFTSGTAYISHGGFQVNGYQGQCGSSQPPGFIPLPSSDVFSYRGFDPAQNTYCSPGGCVTSLGHQYPFNFADLAPNEVPWDAWAGQANCDYKRYPNLFQNCSVIDDAIYNPALVYPTQIWNMDPSWAQCETAWDGLYDPPYLLTLQAEAAAPTPNSPTPNNPPTPVPPTPPSPGSNAGGNPGPTALPETGPTSPGSGTGGGSSSGSGSSNNPRPQPANPSNPGGGIASILGGSSGGGSGSQPGAANPGGSIASILAGEGSTGSPEGGGVASGGAVPGSSASGESGGGGSPPGSSIPGAGSSGGSGSNSGSGANSRPGLSLVPSSSSPGSQAVIPLGSSSLSALETTNAASQTVVVVVSGSTLSIGGPALTTGGATLSAGSSGVVVASAGSSSTAAFSGATAASAAVETGAVVPEGSHSVTALETTNPAGQTVVIVGGETLTEGGAPLATASETLSAGESGVVIVSGETTVTVSYSSFLATSASGTAKTSVPLAAPASGAETVKVGRPPVFSIVLMGIGAFGISLLVF